MGKRMTDEMPPRLPKRDADSHKGTYGTVLAIAGSRDMAGAAVLTATAALRSGAGLVQVACPRSAQAVIAAGFPCYTTIPLNEDGEGRIDVCVPDSLAERMVHADAVAIGPGLGQSASLRDLVLRLVEDRRKPMVVDADGLNALAGLQPRRSETPLILTPHPGEFARLIGSTTEAVQKDRAVLAQALAIRFACIVLLKGQGTIITDGRRLAVNPTGNPGMATGGSGDVLTGVIAALLGQGMVAFEAARLGAWVHGLAGDDAAKRLGMVSMTAKDILDSLPAAFMELERMEIA
jgi:NAD(P)H-hydrate epimerase